MGPRSRLHLLVVEPMSPTRKAAAQGGLWGRPETLPTTTSRQRPVVNDFDLVAAVIRSADDPGYVVIGPSKRVYLRDTTRAKGFVVSVPRYEADTVAQLLDAGHLRLGGTHVVSDGRHEGPARSVLVTTATRAMLARWAALHPPRHRAHGHGTTDSGGGRGGGTGGGSAGPAGRRVLITGSRTWTDTAILRTALAQAWRDGARVLVSGACPTGADAQAEACWRAWGGRIERHPAHWAR